MKLSELERKSIIDINSGEDIGNIIDVIINNGVIDSFIVDKGSRFNIFSIKDDVRIKYSDIQKIGEDVIIVKISK